MRKTLTDRALRSIEEDTTDAVVPGLGVRVSPDTGRKTFILTARYPGSKHPARRSIGVYGDITLEQARAKARQWRELIRQGKDPAIEAERQKAAEVRKQAITFGAVVEDWKRDKLAQERRGARTAADIERDFAAFWNRPIADITSHEVRAAVKAVAVRGTYQAHNSLSHLRRLFSWAYDQEAYGLEASPVDRIKAKSTIGAKKPRTRVLSEDEIRAYWRAASRLRYPYGPLLQMLLMTGQRHGEVAGGRWREIDLQARRWVIPQERFKSDATHIVPLTDDVVELLAGLHRFQKGDCLFSSSFGVNPTPISDQVKRKLDAKMARTLKAMARRRGEDPSRVELRPWVLHDLRRVVRSGLAALRVPDHIAEACIGHGRKGVARIYDQHGYADEMRSAFEAWSERLRHIVAPTPPVAPAANVIPIAARIR